MAAGPSLEARWQLEPATSASAPRELALTVTVEKGWHLNAHDPDRPYLIPTDLEIDAPIGTTVANVHYPDAIVRVLAFAAGSPLRLYEGTFTIRVTLGGVVPQRLEARLSYQACNEETCLPPRTTPMPFQAGGGGGKPKPAE